MRRLLKAVALLVVTAVLVPVATAGTVLASFIFLPLPASVPPAVRGVDTKVSRVFDIDGNLVGEFRRFDISKPARPEDIPQVLKDAVVASEDKRFYEHGGFDVRGTFRAFWADLRSQQVREGGSTITQQYVKNAYLTDTRSITRKVREAVLASQLDRQEAKDHILFLYLDQLYLGEGAYGVGAAAETYFHKEVKDLTLAEAALLAGIIPAPSAYQPRGNAFVAEQRRQVVLGKMLEQGKITQVQHDQAVAERVTLFDPAKPLPKGQAATLIYPRPEQHFDHPYFMDYVERYLDAKYGKGFVYSQGADIYTSMDPRMQQSAEDEIAETLKGTDPPLSMALASVEPGSGWVKALVGGRDYYSPEGRVNVAIGGGGTGRQPGSTFKPFVLAEALEQGVSPDKTYSGRSPVCFPPKSKPYCPENYGRAQYGTLTLREATKHSVNTVYVQLIQDVGVQKVMDRARALGVSTSVYDPARHGLSVALGAPEANPLDMASAYGVWANRGVRENPTPIVKLLGRDGKVLEDNTKPEGHRVMKEETSDLMNQILEGPLQPGGTAAGKDIGRPAAGKTGTTDDNGDAWFTGYTPQLSTSVWLGRTTDHKKLQNIKGVASVTGGTLPAATWQRYMKKAMAGFPVAQFDKPAPVTEILDETRRTARGGYDIGVRRQPVDTDDRGPRPADLPAPVAKPPETTTSTTSTSTTTTVPTLLR